MSQPLVSILIPCYNSEKWLSETIESVLAQTWQNTEVIVVDDGSTDGSLEIAKTFESKNIKVISQENRGASAARNRALIECQGNFIQYLDADDLLAPDKIELQVKLISIEENVNCIASAKWARFLDTLTDSIFIEEPIWNTMSPVDWLICSWAGGGMMPLHAWLTPRSISEKIGEWDESLSLNDDGEYFCRVVLASEGVEFCKDAKSYYRSNLPNSLSRKNSKSNFNSAFRSCQICANHLLKNEDSSRTRKTCATVFQRFIYSVYPDEPTLVNIAEMMVQELGGTDLQPSGGATFLVLANTIGWKAARQIQKLAHSIFS
jgi:glycosyltransferase involved in cell wall biosynthesis